MDVELSVALRVARALESLGIRYLIGGSLASSLHGLPRSSHDADLVAEIPGARADEIASLLRPEFEWAPSLGSQVRSAGPLYTPRPSVMKRCSFLQASGRAQTRPEGQRNLSRSSRSR